jgi:Zn-finger nucleic acid-binding protein
VDRHGLSIEQCDRCRGIFLDHGELEHLLQTEQYYYEAAAPYRGRSDSRPLYGGRLDSPAPYRGHQDPPRPYRGHRDSPAPYPAGHLGQHPDSPGPYGQHGGRRRRSFLGDLFG